MKNNTRSSILPMWFKLSQKIQNRRKDHSWFSMLNHKSLSISWTFATFVVYLDIPSYWHQFEIICLNPLLYYQKSALKWKNLRDILYTLLWWWVHIFMFTAEVKYSKRPGASYAKYGNFVTTVILNNNFVGAIFVNLERIWSFVYCHREQPRISIIVFRE